MTFHKAAVGMALAGLVPGLALGMTQLPAAAELTSTSENLTLDEFRGIGDSPLGLSDLDERGTAAPSAVQRQAASAIDALVRWNDYGTPGSILPRSGSLGRATSSDAVEAARDWLRSHHDLLGLTVAEVAGLELVNSQAFAQSDARAVLFRQRLGGLVPALGSSVTVGVANGEIAYVSSSLAKGVEDPPAALLTPLKGWLEAARNVGIDVKRLDLDSILSSLVKKDGWHRFDVPGMSLQQLARVRGLAMADGTVRPVIEANVVDVQGASTTAYTLMVDAVNGDILHRENKVEHADEASGFQGAMTATQCGPAHPFEITDDDTRSVTVVATTAVVTNDSVIKIFDPEGQLLTTGDLGTSPEFATYSSSDPLPQGTYTTEVCPYDSPTAPFVEPGDYVGAVTLSSSAADGGAAGLPYPPKWSYFPSNPTPRYDAGHTPANSVVGCWVTTVAGKEVEDCSEPTGALRNLASRAPWDVVSVPGIATGLSTMTTLGNNVSDREAWVSPLTPGGLLQGPLSPTREYTPAFEDKWNNSECDPAQLVPGGNDIEFVTNNLFVAHNRMHDYSYFLGFTEDNYNLQLDNHGNGGVAGDPEIGNAQAGALTGGQPLLLGRNNANQVTLQDGVPGITNQYLFQPLAGAFYAPCADGGLDMGIVGHEYTHAITNRMVGGPDEGLTSAQGGAMGESWGDLVAAEYQFSHGYSNGGNVWAVGVYATGNKKTAIRNYAINKNPLTYGELGYDSTGNQVHADGEVWSGTMWRVRQELVKRHDAKFPYKNKKLQLACAAGSGTQSPLPADRCPGNRRWVQLMFDGFLLMQGASSMLDARDAMIAADQMRFGGDNKTALWKGFARSGMGLKAVSPDADAGDVKPSFKALSGNRTVRFDPRMPNGKKARGKLYIGTYEGRSTPVADTLRKTRLGAKAKLAAGTYRALFQGSKTGLTRFKIKVTPGRRTLVQKVRVRKNLAGSGNGAKVTAASPGSLNPQFLIDGTEATNWAGVNGEQNVDEANPYVVVDLAGKKAKKIRRVGVSALLRPAAVELAKGEQEDPESGSRFTALRRFAIEVCTSGCGSDKARWKRVYTSKGNAFPSVRPRPTSPTLAFRSFSFDAVKAKAVRFVALDNQCTGYAGYADPEGGELDADPLNATDCKTGSDRGLSVRAAELEVFSR